MELKDYAIGTLSIVILIGLGFAVDLDDNYFCRERGLSFYCHSVSESTKTCYTQPLNLGRKICYEGWEEISAGIPQPKYEISGPAGNAEVVCDARSCVYRE